MAVGVVETSTWKTTSEDRGQKTGGDLLSSVCDFFMSERDSEADLADALFGLPDVAGVRGRLHEGREAGIPARRAAAAV